MNKFAQIYPKWLWHFLIGESSEKDAICEVTLAATALVSFINIQVLSHLQNTQINLQKRKHLFDPTVT